MSHLSVQFQLNQSLLRRRPREKRDALEFLTETSQKVFHLEIGKLLADADSRSVIEGNVLPLAVRLPRFYVRLASSFAATRFIIREYGIRTPSLWSPYIDVLDAKIVTMLQ